MRGKNPRIFLLCKRIFLLHFFVLAHKIGVCAAQVAKVLVKVQVLMLHLNDAARDVRAVVGNALKIGEKV